MTVDEFLEQNKAIADRATSAIQNGDRWMKLNFIRGEKGSGETWAVKPIKDPGSELFRNVEKWVICRTNERNGNWGAYSFKFGIRTHYAPTLKEAKAELQACIDYVLRDSRCK